jgi:hypothetical protein
MAISISKRCFLTSERVAKVCMCRWSRASSNTGCVLASILVKRFSKQVHYLVTCLAVCIQISKIQKQYGNIFGK